MPHGSFSGQADFETLSFALLILFLCASVLLLFLFSLFLFTHCDLTKPAILFFIEFHRHNYCVIASDRESVAVDVSLSFITDTQPSALFSVGVYPPPSPLTPPQHGERDRSP